MKRSDRVLIRGLQLETVVGILDHERVRTQPLSLDLDLTVDFSQIEHPQDYDHIIDYAAVSKLAVNLATEGEYLLLETMGEDLCAAIFKDFAVQHIRLVIEKPEAVADARWVGVEMERSRPE
ncbi:MAG: dihydroneopterin aldolase [Myxococcota bacterium]|nr:dihydroneopterin aldolase [Myxococcota bacterium]